MTKLKQYKMFINGEWIDSENKMIILAYAQLIPSNHSYA